MIKFHEVMLRISCLLIWFLGVHVSSSDLSANYEEISMEIDTELAHLSANYDEISMEIDTELARIPGEAFKIKWKGHADDLRMQIKFFKPENNPVDTQYFMRIWGRTDHVYVDRRIPTNVCFHVDFPTQGSYINYPTKVCIVSFFANGEFMYSADLKDLSLPASPIKGNHIRFMQWNTLKYKEVELSIEFEIPLHKPDRAEYYIVEYHIAQGSNKNPIQFQMATTKDTFGRAISAFTYGEGPIPSYIQIIAMTNGLRVRSNEISLPDYHPALMESVRIQSIQEQDYREVQSQLPIDDDSSLAVKAFPDVLEIPHVAELSGGSELIGNDRYHEVRSQSSVDDDSSLVVKDSQTQQSPPVLQLSTADNAGSIWRVMIYLSLMILASIVYIFVNVCNNDNDHKVLPDRTHMPANNPTQAITKNVSQSWIGITLGVIGTVLAFSSGIFCYFRWKKSWKAPDSRDKFETMTITTAPIQQMYPTKPEHLDTVREDATHKYYGRYS
eukprot:138091_1